MFRNLFKIAGLCLALALTFGLTGSLQAQTSLGQMAGNVVDATGSVIPGAAIVITNVGTQSVRTVNSDDSGFYTVTNLPIGNYSVTITKTGFRGETRTGISISADAHLTANFELQIGATTEAVTVTAVLGETLNTTSGELAHVIDSKQVENLPLNGHNYTQLMTLIPGAVVTNPDVFSETTSLSAGNQNINGNKSDSANLTVDGAFNMVSEKTSGLVTTAPGMSVMSCV